MKTKRRKLGIKDSDIIKALAYLTLDSELVVVQKNQYALEAQYFDSNYITLIVYKEKEVNSQQYFYYADFKVAKNELMEVLYV
jgi:hypothetical protein